MPERPRDLLLALRVIFAAPLAFGVLIGVALVQLVGPGSAYAFLLAVFLPVAVVDTLRYLLVRRRRRRT